MSQNAATTPCPHCPKVVKTRGLAIHIARAHARRAAAPQPSACHAAPAGIRAPEVIVEVNGERMSLRNLVTLARALRDVGQSLFAAPPSITGGKPHERA